MRILALCALGVVAPLSAQTMKSIVPASLATTEGSSFTSYPFGRSGPCRLQYLYDDSLIPATIANMKALAFRGNSTSTGVAKSNVEVEISLSQNPLLDVFAATTTFASNHGTNKTTVFSRKQINLPAQPGGSPTAPFLTIFPFDSAAMFTYAKAGQGALVVDYQVHAITSGAYTHDTEFTKSATHNAIGTACGASQAATGGTATSSTSTLTYNLSGAPANGTAVEIIGGAQLNPPVPLPQGGCNLHIRPDFVATGSITASGTYRAQFTLDPRWRGQKLFHQFVAVDTGLTALSSTQAHETTIGGYFPHTRIYNLSNATATTGTRQLGVGIVTEFTH